MERKASGSARWRGRRSGEKVGRRHGGDGGWDVRRSAVAGSQCWVSFFFLFLKKTTTARGEWIETDRNIFWTSRPVSGAVRGG
jgi:hypothetical protein